MACSQHAVNFSDSLNLKGLLILTVEKVVAGLHDLFQAFRAFGFPVTSHNGFGA